MALAPLPGIGKGGNLRLVLIFLRLFEKHIVVASGIEGRIKVYKIDTIIRDVLAHYLMLSP